MMNHDLPANSLQETLPATVVIPTYNRSSSLAGTLAALENQRSPPDEVVVVDDCSSDSTPEVCLHAKMQSLPFRMKYVRQKRNLGPAAARNLGVAHSRNDFILFTDDDCEPNAPWSYELVNVLGSSDDLAGVGGPIISADSSRIGLFFDHHRLLDPKFDGSSDTPLYLVTANAAYKKEWFLRVGGFHEDLKKAGGEDPGLSFKITRLGGKLGFAPNAIVRHHYPGKIRSLVRMFWNYGYGGCHVAAANSGRLF